MKIALIHNLYGRFSHGGAETVVEALAREKRAAGHEVFLITTKPRNATGDSGENGMKIYYLNSRFYNLSSLPIFFRFFWQLANISAWHRYRQIKKILKAEKPDVVMTHNLVGIGFTAPVAARRLRIRHEHFLHDIQLLHPSGLMIWGQEKKISRWPAKIYQALTRRLLASPALVISPSAWLLRLHEQHGFFRLSAKEIRPFAFPAAAIPAPRPKDGLTRFLFIGQIEEQKGIFLLLRAFKNMNRKDTRLTIAFRHASEQLAAAEKEAAGDERIKFAGPLSFAAVEEIKKNHDCLIVPSLCYENSPTVITGAHASGLTVIGAALGGIPEMLTPPDQLFRPGDSDDLAAKMKEFIK